MDREARRAIEMLSTAVVQQANMSEHGGRLHATPYNSRVTAERSIRAESPQVATSSSARRQRENQQVVQVQPAKDVQMHAMVNPAGRPAPSNLSSRLKGPVCFSERIRSEPFPADFKGPRKVANYNPSMDPVTWLNNYEMGMSILNASEEICA